MEHIIRHMMGLYGMNTNFAFTGPDFIRYPPSMPTPHGLMNTKKMKERFEQQNAMMNTKLQDFKQMYQQYAKGLLEMNSSLIPPGHPLFSRTQSASTLHEENDKLKQENMELRKQLEKLSKESPKHNPQP